LGYYTLSMTAISAPLIAKATLEKLPKYPIPAALTLGGSRRASSRQPVA